MWCNSHLAKGHTVHPVMVVVVVVMMMMMMRRRRRATTMMMVTHMREIRNVYKIVVDKDDWKR
jgi:hypothetical protein